MYDWIISDTHFNHVNIVKYSGRPANHNELMQQNWRKLVRPDDTVLHLGDVLMGPQELWSSMPGWLPGKVTFIEGNHDRPNSHRPRRHQDTRYKIDFMEKEWGWTMIHGYSTIEYGGYTVYFTHAPMFASQDPSSNNNTDLVYRELDDNMLNVHGHIHEKETGNLRHINVSVEKIDYQPVSLKLLLDARINLLEKQ